MSADLQLALPEIILAIGAMVLLIYGAWGSPGERTGKVVWAAAALMAVIGLWLAAGGAGQGTAFGGDFVADRFALFAKVVVLFVSALMLLLSEGYLTRRGVMSFEYAVLIMLATLGMMLMVSAGGLIPLYMGLELQSLSLYVVAAFNRNSVRSTEAGLKYFVLGALASGMLLYGASLVYGYAGTTRFDGIARVIADEGLGLGLTFGLVFICAGLAFKLSAVPFHMWTPDVYEGAPTPVTAFFATAPKMAAGALFARVLFDGFGNASEAWQQILVFVAIASMFLGAIAAIGQTNLKRLMAYSSIGHMGYALTGLAAGTEAGAQALLVYLVIYLVMNLGVFAFILMMERDGQPVVGIADLAGLARTRPGHALALAVLLFSLAGIPPLVGFFAKFFVFKAAIDAGLVGLALAGAVASVIGAYYYLNIVRIMYLSEPEQPLELRVTLLHGATVGLAALFMAAGWMPFLGGLGIPDMALAAAQSLTR